MKYLHNLMCDTLTRETGGMSLAHSETVGRHKTDYVVRKADFDFCVTTDPQFLWANNMSPALPAKM